MNVQTKSGASYHAAWREYRRQRSLYILAFLSWMPVGGGIIVLADRLRWNAAAALAALIVWAFVILVQGWRWSLWPCPRCGKAYRGWISFPLVLPRRCYYCKLPRWAESSDS